MDRATLIEVAARAILSAWTANGNSIEAVQTVCRENGVAYDDGVWRESADRASRIWREGIEAMEAIAAAGRRQGHDSDPA